jgi:hypothetical protein
VSSLDDDHSVRIDASRNQHQMLGCSCDETASVAERRDHRDLRVRDGADDNRRGTGLAGQQLPEAVHPGCHSGPGPDLAELAVWHDTASHQGVRSRQRLSRRDPNQSRQRCQLS